jgi:hypothetical protein
MVENERTMVRLNDDGTATVCLIRTIARPLGPIAKDLALEADTRLIMTRHAAAFMFPFAKRRKASRD